MSDNSQETMDMATQPLKEHQWLKQLLGEWRIESEMVMEPGGPSFKSTGTAKVTDLGGLWAVFDRKEMMPGNMEMISCFALGYDVTFKEYRGCMFCSVSSHLWKYTGELSADDKTMTLNCEGPSMTEETGMALYRDILTIVDENHLTWTSLAQDDAGAWQEFAKSDYYRV